MPGHTKSGICRGVRRPCCGAVHRAHCGRWASLIEWERRIITWLLDGEWCFDTLTDDRLMGVYLKWQSDAGGEFMGCDGPGH